MKSEDSNKLTETKDIECNKLNESITDEFILYTNINVTVNFYRSW